MRLSRLYSNRPKDFGPIEFGPGLNVVLGEVRVPENRTRSTHNLGKTTLARVIDFCLCRGKHKDFFLFKHEELFKSFVFFLELETVNGNFVTIRRSVEAGSKLSLALRDEGKADYSSADESFWNHFEVGFDSGRQLLDGILDLTAIKPWSFRIPVGYALRTQRDFADVFQLSKHLGKHRDWKPYVAHILGFDATLVEKGYGIDERIERLQASLSTLRLELGAADVSLDQIRGLIEFKEKEVVTEEAAAERFDFELEDASVNKKVVEELDIQIGSLNRERYSLSNTKRRIRSSLEAETIQFRPRLAQRLFEEAGTLFPDQLVRDFDALIRFNEEISTERIDYLKEELANLNSRLEEVSSSLADLNRERQNELRFLGDIESMEKFREVNRRLVILKNELASLERQRDALLGIRNKEKELRGLKRDREDQVEELTADIDKSSQNKEGRYSRIRKKLAEFADRILGHKALITTTVNQEGNIEFTAEFLDLGDIPTSEHEGKSYQQTLCAAYDLAITDELLDDAFIRFVYHDGLLEGLDDRVKLNLIHLLRELADRGVQQILTVIDSDLPIDDDGERFQFTDDEVVLVLHDEGEAGRLFRMPGW